MNGIMIFYASACLLALFWGKQAVDDVRRTGERTAWLRVVLAGICALLMLDGLLIEIGV